MEEVTKFLKERSVDKQAFINLRKYALLLPSLWMAHLSMGATIAVVGPSLPYLGLNVRQSLSVVSFVYTARSVGFVFTSIGTGLIFRRLTQGWQKMLWIALGLLIMAISIISVPFFNNIILLLLALFVYGVGTAMIDTADNSLVIFLLGPKKSRPIVQSLHFTLAIGAFILPFIIRPFLVQMGEKNSTQEVCSTSRQNTTTTGRDSFANVTVTMEELASSPLVWPYVIVASLCVIACFMFLALAVKRPEMKEFHGIAVDAVATQVKDEHQNISPSSTAENAKIGKAAKLILIPVFILFYILHCGTENVFWSHLYAFGICSQLKMSASDASSLNMAFFGGFLAGRGSGVFVAKCLRPRTIIIIASIGCVVTTGILSLWGQTDSTVTIISCIIYGYSIAMTFASGICWLAEHINVTGGVSSTWFIGAYTGISVLPPLAGLLFDTSVGAIGAMYLTFGTSAAVVLVFAVMNIILRFGKKKDEEGQEIEFQSVSHF